MRALNGDAKLVARRELGRTEPLVTAFSQRERISPPVEIYTFEPLRGRALISSSKTPNRKASATIQEGDAKSTDSSIENPIVAGDRFSAAADVAVIDQDDPNAAGIGTLTPDYSDLDISDEAAAETIAEIEHTAQVESARVGTTRQRVMMLVAVCLPIIGLIAGGALSWMYGFMGWTYLIVMLVGWKMTGMGITIGFHRLLTHRSFKSVAAVRFFWVAMGSMAVQGSPLLWCAIHRRHHQCSDNDGDPHSPHLHEGGWWQSLKGFTHAHLGWLFGNYWDPPKYERYVPELLQDKITMFAHRYYFGFVVASFVIPAAICGAIIGTWSAFWLGMLWGGLVRLFITQHVTWSINSVCHVFGKQEFESADLSTNNVVFGILAHGEGWHNNHHAFPSSARHGLLWWQFDLSWCIIRGLEMCRLVWDVKLPTKRAMDRKRLKLKRV